MYLHKWTDTKLSLRLWPPKILCSNFWDVSIFPNLVKEKVPARKHKRDKNWIKNSDNNNNNMIPEFFQDQEIFITGGTGKKELKSDLEQKQQIVRKHFSIQGIVGTALIEQILRSCNVRKIFLLLRQKKNMTPEERLAKVKEGLVS